MNQKKIPKQTEKAERFANNLIDTIGFFFLVFLHAMVLDSWLGVVPEGGSDWFPIYLIFLYPFYHFIFEYFLQKTPGKFLTRTKVVDENGSKPNFKTLLMRNACRLIPFDNLSFLFSERGWHDAISDTYVVAD